jgi:hypothetical protein
VDIRNSVRAGARPQCSRGRVVLDAAGARNSVGSAGLQILQHSLGVDQYGRGQQYRNRFVTGPESTDFDACVALVTLGLMKDLGAVAMYGGMHYFEVTREGKAYVSQNSPPPPKLTRGQKRYEAFLRADSGLSFGEWLRSRWAGNAPR